MFGRKARNIGNAIPKDILNFLHEADILYIRSFETRNIKVLKDYFTRECIIKLSRVIVNEAAARYYGNEKFRVTTWTPIEVTDSYGSYEKSVVYDAVKVSGTFNMKVSQDYKEIWKISITPTELFVTDVSRL